MKRLKKTRYAALMSNKDHFLRIFFYLNSIVYEIVEEKKDSHDLNDAIKFFTLTYLVLSLNL